MLITLHSLETHNIHWGRSAESEAEVNSPIVENAHYSSLPWDSQHTLRTRLRSQRLRLTFRLLRMLITLHSLEIHSINTEAVVAKSEVMFTLRTWRNTHYSALFWEARMGITELSVKTYNMHVRKSWLRIKSRRLVLHLSMMLITLQSLETHNINWGRGCKVRGCG